MKKEIIINTSSSESRIAILEDSELVELYVEHPENQRMVGDIYKGKIENVVKAIQAAFVDIGLEQNGFLSFADFDEEFISCAERVDSSDTSSGRKGRSKSGRRPHMRIGDELLVQVTKEPIGTKGARLTSSISLPGRFIVLVPNDDSVGVSRKISNGKERNRLRRIAKSLRPDGFGLIVRTVAVDKDIQVLKSDLESLLKKWEKILAKSKNQSSSGLIHKDLGITSSVIRDLFSPDISQLVVDSRKLYSAIKKYLKDVAPNLMPKLELYKSKTPIFDSFQVEDAITKSLSRKIWMKSGGYCIFDQTEALMVVDVNSGRSIKEKDHEQNALKTDLEAAELIARQLRLRDIGGIIVIDFIDLMKEPNRNKVVSVLKRELSKDKVAFDILPMNNFGLVSLTRSRVRPSLLYRYSEPCPRCEGLGRVPAKSAVITQIERKIQQIKKKTGQRRFTLHVHPAVAAYLKEGTRSIVRHLMLKFFVTIKIVETREMLDNEFELTPLKSDEKL